MKICSPLPILFALVAILLFSPFASARLRGPVAPSTPPSASRSASATAAKAKTAPANEVRLVYYSGDVAVRDSAAQLPLALGMLIDSTHVVTVPRGASLQLAVDGRIVVIERAATLRRADIVRRASGETNEELMAALRSLGAQGEHTASTMVSPARVQAALATAISPSTVYASMRPTTGSLIPLEPRQTAVTRGPVRFRWLRQEDSATYRVIVRDRYRDEVFRAETSDTTVIWESAVLFVGTEYEWTLARVDDSLEVVASLFERLDDLKGMRLEGGESRIRLALGSENPALPLVLGAHFALHGCYADAVRWYTTAALRNPEHFDRFMRLARELYATNIGLSTSELEHVQTLGPVTMN
jgi:hypothetical protein